MSLLDRLPETNLPKWTPPDSRFESVGITKAYNDLTCRAFNIWVRLHTCTPHQLKVGRVRLSRALRVSEPTFNRAVRELSTKGYLVTDSRAYKNRTIVRLARRARTGGSNLFIKV